MKLAFRACRRAAELRGVYGLMYPLLSYVYTEWIESVGGAILSTYGEYHSTDNTCEVNHGAVVTMANVVHPNGWDLLGK